MTVLIGTVLVKLDFKAGSMARDARRDEVMDAAMAVLIERGYRDTTMLAVAKKASASKETLYAWFGDKAGLFEAIIRRNAKTVAAALTSAIDDGGAPEQVLAAFGTALLQLLLGEESVAINRAAIGEVRNDPSLATVLAERGREATLPLLIDYLVNQKAAGTLNVEDAEEAAQDLLGLLVGDLQVRRLLARSASPEKQWAAERAAQATGKFLKLYRA